MEANFMLPEMSVIANHGIIGILDVSEISDDQVESGIEIDFFLPFFGIHYG